MQAESVASIATEFLGGALRLLGEWLVEWLFQRTGHALLNRRSPQAEPGLFETLVGALFWLLIVALAVWAWSSLAST